MPMLTRPYEDDGLPPDEPEDETRRDAERTAYFVALAVASANLRAATAARDAEEIAWAEAVIGDRRFDTLGDLMLCLSAARKAERGTLGLTETLTLRRITAALAGSLFVRQVAERNPTFDARRASARNMAGPERTSQNSQSQQTTTGATG